MVTMIAGPLAADGLGVLGKCRVLHTHLSRCADATYREGTSLRICLQMQAPSR